MKKIKIMLLVAFWTFITCYIAFNAGITHGQTQTAAFDEKFYDCWMYIDETFETEEAKVILISMK